MSFKEAVEAGQGYSDRVVECARVQYMGIKWKPSEEALCGEAVRLS